MRQDISIRIKSDPIHDNKASATKRVSSHKRFSEVIQTSSINNHPRMAYSVDQWTSGGITHEPKLVIFYIVERLDFPFSLDHSFCVRKRARLASG